jgi:hypothetical protein
VFIGGLFILSESTAEPDAALPSAAQTRQAMYGTVTVHAPDAFYDPPADLPKRPGVLLRSERLEDVALPAGMTGWRILYTTTVNDKTSATAVAVVIAPIRPSAGPRPVITWEHATTGVLQKCMPSLWSEPAVLGRRLVLRTSHRRKVVPAGRSDLHPRMDTNRDREWTRIGTTTGHE